MSPQEKRELIIKALAEKTKETGIEISISSPPVKYFYIGSKSGTKHSFDATSIDEAVLGSIEHTVAEYTNSSYLAKEEPQDLPEFEAIQEELEEKDTPDYENLSYKEFKRLKKEQQKENKDQIAEEKRLNRIRRDAHKRGFDTTVLMQFDDPEELYEMSDEQITQMQAAGYINEDGFYDFVYPFDALSLKKERLSTKKKLMIAGLGLAGAGILAWVFLSIYSTLNIFA